MGNNAVIDAAFEAAHKALSKRIARLVELAIRQRLQDIHDDLVEHESETRA